MLHEIKQINFNNVNNKMYFSMKKIHSCNVGFITAGNGYVGHMKNTVIKSSLTSNDE